MKRDRHLIVVESARRYRRRKKLRAIEYLGGKCERCGYSECPGAMDFHHKDPLVKEHEVSQLIRKNTWEKVTKELDKCVLLCANCHRSLHWNESGDIDATVRNSYRTIEELAPRQCPTCSCCFLPKTREQTFCSRRCVGLSMKNPSRKVQERPAKSTIRKMVKDCGWEATGRHYGVTGNAVRKWMRA